ncbi:hypothetical protein [Rubrivivax gelatinosus]|uniref:Uncharacterized protein n=1 Tax=Rubrivivax gelatinosus TaxID=28068 RepID=A0A4V2SGU2_RUBGE|nr:hypothetical protein [Rubrivivax gelatinosus]MBK1688165.1 hypothetical protein [Rubrivivax gelatinosus]TCP02528.1 hypothetical protein EV684_10690 [Rubrivivax gelatinosus]
MSVATPATRRAVVATSLNPHDRIAHQRACFERWRALGVEALSFNHAAERERLIEAGLPAEALVEIGDEDTMLPFGGRPMPRIVPLLERLLAGQAEVVLVVNSDLFPAVSRNPLPLMAAQAAASGYVRSDCSAVDEPAGTPKAPYHGGLDAFCFRTEGLADLVARLRQEPAAERMAFGVPGWDLYVGHEVLAIGGRLLEARFLLHPRHAAGYASIDPFAEQAAAMLASGRYAANDHVELAAEFVARIRAQCLRHLADTRMMQSALADPVPPAVRADTDGRAPEQQTLPGSLVQAQKARPDWRTLHLSHEYLATRGTRLSVYLVALRAALALMREQGRTGWTTHYPKGSAHAEQLQSFLGEADAVQRRERILDLLAIDLYEHAVLNLHLLKYLRVHCRHEQEERLFAALMHDLRGALT